VNTGPRPDVDRLPFTIAILATAGELRNGAWPALTGRLRTRHSGIPQVQGSRMKRLSPSQSRLYQHVYLILPTVWLAWLLRDTEGLKGIVGVTLLVLVPVGDGGGRGPVPPSAQPAYGGASGSSPVR
jgi:hypothetical protein